MTTLGFVDPWDGLGAVGRCEAGGGYDGGPGFEVSEHLPRFPLLLPRADMPKLKGQRDKTATLPGAGLKLKK